MTPPFVQDLVAFVLRLGVHQLCLVPLQVGLRRGPAPPGKAGVDHDQQFAAFDILTFRKFTCMIWPSIRVLSETVLNAGTEPSPVR